jgi:argininosuccinate lyase
MTKKREYIRIGKMTHVPKEQKDRGHGWFYQRPGIGRLMEDREPFDTYEPRIPYYWGYHLFDVVHVIMLTEQEIIPQEIGVQLLKALKEMEHEGIDDARKKAGGVAHSGEAYLIQRLGWDVGGYIHAGRSSNDLAPTYRRVQQRHFLLDIADALNDLRAALLTLAKEQVNTIVPEYTVIQHARPMTLGYLFEAWVHMLERNFTRFELAYKHTNISPMGSTDGTGSDFPLNLNRTAELAGFDDVFKNGLDATYYSIRDEETEMYALLRMITDVTASIGETLQLWCSYEFRMAKIADRYAATSSIMSQKKNPFVHILIRAAKTIRALGFSGGNIDAAIRETINSLKYTKGILTTTTWNVQRMRELCEYGFTCNASLCRILVQEKELPWRTAHQITAIMARKAHEMGIQMRDVTPEFLDECATEYVGYGKPLQLPIETLEDAWNIEKNVANQDTHGGTAPVRVLEQIAISHKILKQDQRSVKIKREKLAAAAQKRERAIDALIERT